jgi:Carboxypeptidase regulatory-like domain/TonB dependent receptor/TonB-dependent Receptor Plug Domain
LKFLRVLVSLLFFCVTIFANAQSTDATISGIVIDPSGKVIVDADIEILSEATGARYSGRTNGSGIYSVPILPPGQYRIQVSKVGFKTLIKPGIVLNVQSAVALNFTLPLGAISESVTVEAGTSTINTTDASVSTVIDRKFVENIPLNGRSFQDLISLTPGVVTQSPQATSSVGSQGDFSVNGQRTEENYYTIDGVSANVAAGTGGGSPGPANSGSMAASTALGTTQSLISVDALQEFRVESSTYSAEYGRAPGAQFALVTKAGTNEFHGTVFNYLRNNYFDANNWFNDHYGDPSPALRQNDFGGTLGGAVLLPRIYDGKGRTFVFVSHEGLRLTQPQAASVQYVPDQYLRQQAPAVLQPILNAYPVQNGIDYGSVTSPSLAQFIAPYSLPSQIDSTSVRVDQKISTRFSAFLRAGYTPSSVASRALSAVTETPFLNQTYTLGITAQLARSINNEFRLGYADGSAKLISHLDSFGGATPINLASAMDVGPAGGSQEFYMTFPGTGQSPLSLVDSGNQTQQWNLVDTTSLQIGRQQLKFGIDYRRLRSPLTPISPFELASYFTPQQVLTNSADYVEASVNNPSIPIFDETALFAQDEWHISQRVSLSGGVRWEADPPPTGANGDDAYTILGNVNDPSSLSVAPHGTPLWKTAWYNFAPRLGIAWQAHVEPGWETVIRTGAGVFFDTNNQNATRGFDGPGFSTYQLYYGASLPLTQGQLELPVMVTSPYGLIYAYPQHLQPPYTWQWNASLEQSLGKSQSLTISYIGANGRRQTNENLLDIGSLNPNFTYVCVFQGGATSNYQGLQAKFQRSIGHGLQALVAYTWSHSIDFGSQNVQIPVTRGSSDFDVRQTFQAGVSWDLPAVASNSIGKAVTLGWAIDGRVMARTAFPITLQGNELIGADGGYYYSGVDLVPSEPYSLYGDQYPGGRALNPAAFVLPSGSSVGNAPRNFLRGFGAAQANLAVRRTFHLYANLNLQFRAETFNLTNHPNFGFVDPYLYDLTFGQATKTLNQSLGTVASQYQQGGARSLQFALKLMF